MSINVIREEILESAHDELRRLHRSEAVFKVLTSIVTEAGFLTNPQWSPLHFKDRRTGCAIEGYDIDEEDGVMTVFALVDAHIELELDRTWQEITCAKKEVDRALKELIAAVEAIEKGEVPPMEDSNPAIDLVKSLSNDYRPSDGRVVCCLLTTGRVSSVAAESLAEAKIRTMVWDADRLIRTRENGREALVADFESIGGIPCLVSAREAEEIQEGRLGVVISKVPGSFLAQLYNEYRGRLLERNVRTFLQFTGKVNKGIRTTIHEEPEHFLSFNNGISCTASRVRLRRSADGNYRLLAAEDFQIVNGGQTTASIARCVREDRVDVSSISVAMKLTVVPPDLISKLVPRISRFANTQNRIQETDFSANDPWQIELERHSRTLEADRDAGSGGRPVRWYYERVRGQYAEDLAKLATRPQKEAFRARHPARTRFEKTDLAKYLLAWEQEAHSVSLGGQKAFARLTSVLGATSTNADSSQMPSEEDFRRICCLAIIQNHGERICGEFGIKGYRANLVAYAIMVLSVKSGKKLPWRRLWISQEVTGEVDRALRIAIPACDAAIRFSAGTRNVTEWAKKQECREFVLGRSIELSLAPDTDWDHFSVKDMARPKAELDVLKVFQKLSAEQWLLVAATAERDEANPVWVGVARTMASQLMPKGRSPSEKQMKILRKTLVRYGNIAQLATTLSIDDRKVLEGGS
jgi:hypothetical protein